MSTKKLYAIILLILSTFLVGFTPPPHNDKFVVDQADVLTQSEEDKINERLVAYEEKTNNEVAVLLVKTLGGEPPAEAAHDTFNTWGIGKKEYDNGVLILISIEDRKWFIATGNGVEGDLPDALCNQIFQNNIAPHLKNKQYFSAIDSGVDGVTGTLEGRPDAVKKAPEEEGIPLWLTILLFVIFIIILSYLKSGGSIGYSSGGYSGGSYGGGSSGGFGGFGGGSSGGGGAGGSW